MQSAYAIDISESTHESRIEEELCAAQLMRCGSGDREYLP